MKDHLISFSLGVALALFAAPLMAWADANPDFNDDARPILRAQPGLLQYVKAHFDVQDTGTAKYPGDDDHRPMPPFIFRARPLGSSGPYNLSLLIQPGPPGHILGVVDMTKVQLSAPPTPSAPQQPAVASKPPITPPAPVQTAPVTPPVAAPPAPAAPAADQSSGPTSDTPSGPITDSGTPVTPPPPSAPSLAPPPDPPPATH